MEHTILGQAITELLSGASLSPEDRDAIDTLTQALAYLIEDIKTNSAF